jgi:hypothetical protein
MAAAKPILIFGSLVLAGLGAALAVVAQRPAPAPSAPMQASDFAPFHPESSEPDSAGDGTGEGTDDDATTQGTVAEVPTIGAEVAAAQGTGRPTRSGPSVGVNPARAEEPIQLLNPVDYGEPDEEPVGEGTGNPHDPFGENDHAAGTVSREETFANNIQAQYVAVSEVIANCVEGMPAATRDTVHVEMIVRDAPGGARSIPSIENFQSSVLADDRAACARRGFEAMDLPLPWLATAIEAPGFTVVADTAVEYSLEFEVEIGAE